jgi:hypothetical protein
LENLEDSMMRSSNRAMSIATKIFTRASHKAIETTIRLMRISSLQRSTQVRETQEDTMIRIHIKATQDNPTKKVTASHIMAEEKAYLFLINQVTLKLYRVKLKESLSLEKNKIWSLLLNLLII